MKPSLGPYRFSCLLLFSGFLGLLRFTPVWLWGVLLGLIALAWLDRGIVPVSTGKEEKARSAG